MRRQGRIEYVRLPDEMPPLGQTGRYDADGQPSDDGSVTITSLGVQFVWARFSAPIGPGQIATMVFTNLVSTAGGKRLTAASVMDGAATEWDPAADRPTIGDAVVELLAVERGMGVGRIVCRNTYDAGLEIAAGLACPIALPSGPPPG